MLIISFFDSSKTVGDSSIHNTRAAGKNLQLFTALRPCVSNDTDEIQNKALIKQFILDLNVSNSGIVDSLCKLITTLVSHDLHVAQQQVIMSTEMLELVTDTIYQVQSSLIQDIASNTALDQQERVFVCIHYASNTLPSLTHTCLICLDLFTHQRVFDRPIDSKHDYYSGGDATDDA